MKRVFLIACLLCLAPAHARAGEMLASYYGSESGARTANGERFNENAMTCAYWGVPFNTMLRVTYRGRSVICRVNDRGPAHWTRRGIDVSRGVARGLGMIGAGVGRVSVERL